MRAFPCRSSSKARDRQVLAIDELTKDEAENLPAALRESRPAPGSARFDDEARD